MPRVDWRSYDRFARAAANFTEIPWTDERYNALCDYLEQIDERLIPLFLAILIQEGTGSFNTSSDNMAGDGGHGAESDWDKDIRAASDLILGKLMLYPQAVDQGFCERAARIVSVVDGDTWTDNGTPVQWLNWPTAVVRSDGSISTYAMYAQDAASWWVNVQWLYERNLNGSRDALIDICRNLEQHAPLVEFTFGWTKSNRELAGTYDGNSASLIPVPAVIVTEANIVSQRVHEKRPDLDPYDPEAPELAPSGSYAEQNPGFVAESIAAGAQDAGGGGIILYVNNTQAGQCEWEQDQWYLTTPLVDLLNQLGYVRGPNYVWNTDPPCMHIIIRPDESMPDPGDGIELDGSSYPVYLNGVPIGMGLPNASGRMLLHTPLTHLLYYLGYHEGQDWVYQEDPPGVYIQSKW